MEIKTHEGYIKLFRGLRDHWLWEDPIKLKWWLDLLMTVNYSDKKVAIGYKVFECKRGQTVRSLKTIGNKWDVSKDIIRHFLMMLEQEGMIKVENLKVTTRITICNFDYYQGSSHEGSPQSHHNLSLIPIESHPNKNKKNEKNERSAGELQPPTIEEVKLYFKKNGYPESLAQRAFDYYSVNDWKDGKGRPVKNWKQKFISVWFKEENKTSTEKSSFGTPGLSIDKIK